MTEVPSRPGRAPASWPSPPTAGQRRALALLDAAEASLALPRGPSRDRSARVVALMALAATLLPEPNRLALADLVARASGSGEVTLRALLVEAREIAARAYAS